MKKNIFAAMIAAFCLSFGLTGCFNGMETSVVPLPPSGSSSVNGVVADGNTGAGNFGKTFSEKDLATLLVEIGREYDGFLQRAEQGGFFDGVGTREGGFDEFVEENFPDEEFLTEKLDEIYPSYMKGMDFFLSLLRLDDCRESFSFSENIELSDFSFTQLKNAFNVLKEHYENNYNSDYYFPSYDEVLKPYEFYLNIFNRTSRVNDFNLNAGIEFNAETSEFGLQLENKMEVSISDFNGMLKMLFPEITCNDTSMPIQSVVIKSSIGMNADGDYAVTKEAVKDVNLDGTLGKVGKLSFVVDSLKNLIVNANMEFQFLVETESGKNYTIIIEPALYLEKEDYDYVINVIQNENKSFLYKMSELGKKDFYVTISVMENFHQIFINTFTLDELLNFYIKEVK